MALVELPRLPNVVAAALSSARQFATRSPNIRAVGLAGSWARGAGRRDSDLDLVVLTTRPDSLLGSAEWFSAFGCGAELVRSSDFGAIHERRLRLSNGLVIEVGIGALSWARIDPIDPGTHRVVSDGFVPVYDPDRQLAALARAVYDTKSSQAQK